MSTLVLFIPHNHYDPTWRRCFRRDAEYHDTVVRSYAEVEAAGINAFLALADRGYTFSEGQTAIWREYLNRYPESLPRLRELAKTGQLSVMLAGETVQDSNLSAAEGLIRNFLVARPMYRELVGEDHPGLEIAWLEDAFGNSSNLPQVLAGVGAKAVACTSYHQCPSDVWVGLDGTAIPCLDHGTHPYFSLGVFEKFPPCPACRGRGCAACNESGMIFTTFDVDQVCDRLQQALDAEGDWAVVSLLAEELLPDARFPDLIEELNAQYAGKGEIRFATPADIYARVIGDLAAKASEQQGGEVTEDLNPAMPGCMVSRIATKQRTRAVTYALLAAEAKLANDAWDTGSPAAPPEAMADAWRNVVFNQFHDAITGTHIDQAYIELMDMLDDAQRVADSFLPPKPTDASAETFEPLPDVETTLRMGDMDVTVDKGGIVSVLLNGEDLFGRAAYTPSRPPLRVGELLLEGDFGDAWGQRIAPHGWPSNVMAVPLSGYQTQVESDGRAVRWTGNYDGGDPKVRRLAWVVTASPSEDGKRIDFTVDVDWDTASRRLRVVFPVQSQEETATYEIPFGFMDRAYDASQLDYGQWESNTMEWPTLHWARKAIDQNRGVALLNRGLPCYRWRPGQFELSLVRSPEYSFCAVEPGHYEFWDIDGQRDAGRHRFEYSIWPYDNGLDFDTLTRAGYAYNMPTPLNPPFEIEGNVIVTAWKPAEDGRGWVLRLQETVGTATRVNVTFAKPRTVTRVDLLERPQGEPRSGVEFSADLHKHGLLTLLIQ